MLSTFVSHLNPSRYIKVDMEPSKESKEPKAEISRHKTQKNASTDATFANLLEDSAREAYVRPWHRIERGLRLNRLRIFIEDVSPQYAMTKEEKDGLFLFLQKALDKKLLNTLKIVNYDQETQRITAIKGLDMKRTDAGLLKWGFSEKKPKTIETRKKKKEEVPFVSTVITKIEQVSPQ